jgi:hypothetical protein
MFRALPVPEPPPDTPPMTGLKWELAAPDMPKGPQVGQGNEVTMIRSGPGDSGYSDEWLNPDIFDVPHNGQINGRAFFDTIPPPPPEGHKGYDFPDTDDIGDRSHRNLAIFWSDWYGSTTAGSGLCGSFRGEHVVIGRIPPGSTQGYMPSDPGMEQSNNDRSLPGPWDAAIVLGSALGG